MDAVVAPEVQPRRSCVAREESWRRSSELYDPATNAWTTLPDGITAWRPSLVPGDGVFWQVTADGVTPLARIGGG